MLHYAPNILAKHGIALATAKSTGLSFNILTQLWHEVAAQMLVDGVPFNRMPIGGVLRQREIWRACRHRLASLSASGQLQLCKYDASLDKSRVRDMAQACLPYSTNREGLEDLVDEDGIQHEAAEDGIQHEAAAAEAPQIASQATQAVAFEWPSESGRYEVITVASDLLTLTYASKTKKALKVLEVGTQDESFANLADIARLLSVSWFTSCGIGTEGCLT